MVRCLVCLVRSTLCRIGRLMTCRLFDFRLYFCLSFDWARIWLRLLCVFWWCLIVRLLSMLVRLLWRLLSYRLSVWLVRRLMTYFLRRYRVLFVIVIVRIRLWMRL